MIDESNIPEGLFASFISAIKSQSLQQVEEILRMANPAIVNKLESQFRQPSLYFAALLPSDDSSAEFIKLLIRNGANAKFKDYNDQTILFYICREGKDKCAEILLSHGLSLDEVDIYGQTPLFYAVNQNRLDIVRKYATKERVNHADKLAGQTPLYYSARRGHLQMTKLLIDRGADIFHTDTTNKSPIEYAKKGKFIEVTDYLNSELKRSRQTIKVNGNSQSLQDSNLEKRKRNSEGLKDTKQTYKLVFLNDKGEPRELSEQEVSQIIKHIPGMVGYLANPDSIPQDYLNATQNDCWQKAAMKILTHCLKFKGAFYFLEPVDPVKLGILDYFDIVTNPMDLGTVRKKLTHNCYNQPSTFVRDMKLIWNNSFKYNGMNNVVSKCGQELENTFNQQIKITGLDRYLDREEEAKRIEYD